MNAMRILDEAARRAQDQPTEGAAYFLDHLDRSDEQRVIELVDILIAPDGFAHLPMDLVLDYERVGYPVLVQGQWGELWLIPTDSHYYRNLDPAAPAVTMRGLRDLGRALIVYLASDEPEALTVPAGLFPYEEVH